MLSRNSKGKITIKLGSQYVFPALTWPGSQNEQYSSKGLLKCLLCARENSEYWRFNCEQKQILDLMMPTFPCGRPE